MPYPLPLVSRGAPAYTNDDYGGSYPASNANNATYGGTDYWRCIAAPAGGANSGILTQYPAYTTPFPVYLAYDLSGVANLGQVLLHWDQSAVSGQYNPALIGFFAFNTPTSYTIDVNAAPGGSYPTSGWVTKFIVSNSAPYHSRQFLFDMTGYKWVRIYVTAVTGSGGGVNSNCALNMDIHDARLGVSDCWLCTGDSITQFAFEYNDQGGMSAVMPQQINNAFPGFFPIWEDAGIVGWTATDAEAVLASTWLPMFPGKYVTLNWGKNDATGGGALVTNFSEKMQSMITSILAAGKTPVLPSIMYGSLGAANILTLNGQITSLIAANPGCIAGPDLYTAFFNNQGYIDSDNIHPTVPDGYNFYRTQWVNWAASNIYNKVLVTSAQSKYKVRTVLNTPAQSSFKVRTKLRTSAQSKFTIQLSGVGPKPYMVTSVVTKIVPRPFSTINSQATVIDQNNVPQSGLNITVTVTFPDNSTATPTVYTLGNGVYSTTYETKGVGTMEELWVFSDAQGSQIEHQNPIPVSF